MAGETCIICGNTRAKDKSVSTRIRGSVGLKLWTPRTLLSRTITVSVVGIFPTLTHGTIHSSQSVGGLHNQRQHWTGKAKRAKKREEVRREVSLSPSFQVSPFSSLATRSTSICTFSTTDQTITFVLSLRKLDTCVERLAFALLEQTVECAIAQSSNSRMFSMELNGESFPNGQSMYSGCDVRSNYCLINILLLTLKLSIPM